jgi:hypothetical protein
VQKWLINDLAEKHNNKIGREKNGIEKRAGAV